MQYSESGGTTKETWPLTVKRVLEDVKRPNPESDPTRWLISSDLPTVHQCGEAVQLVEKFGPTWQAIATQGSGAFQREDAKSIHNKIDQLYQKLVAEHQKQTGESLLAQQAVLFSIQAYQSISTWDVLKAANEVGEPVPGETLAQTLIKQTRVIRDKCVTPASFHEDIEQRLAELAEDEKTPAHYKEVFAELLKELIAKVTDIQDEKKQQRLKRQQLKNKKNAFKLGPNRQVTGAGVVEALKAQEEEQKRNQEEKEEKRRAKAAKAADKKRIQVQKRLEKEQKAKKKQRNMRREALRQRKSQEEKIQQEEEKRDSKARPKKKSSKKRHLPDTAPKASRATPPRKRVRRSS